MEISIYVALILLFIARIFDWKTQYSTDIEIQTLESKLKEMEKTISKLMEQQIEIQRQVNTYEREVQHVNTTD